MGDLQVTIGFNNTKAINDLDKCGVPYFAYFGKPPCIYQLVTHFIDDNRWMVIPFGNLIIRFVKGDSCYFPNGNYTIREIDLEQFSVFFNSANPSI